MKPKLIDYQSIIYYGLGYADSMRKLAEHFKDEDKLMRKAAMTAAYFMERAAKEAIERIPPERKIGTLRQAQSKYVELKTKGVGMCIGKAINERVISMDDLNAAFDSDPLVCVMCDKTDKEKKKCIRYKMAHKYDFDIPCTLEDGT